MTFFEEWPPAYPGSVVVSLGPHHYPAGLDEHLLTLLLHRVRVLGHIGVVTLGNILLSALAFFILLNILFFLLPDNTDHSISFLHSPREVYSSVLKCVSM